MSSSIVLFTKLKYQVCAHKVVLSASSSFFRQFFLDNNQVLTTAAVNHSRVQAEPWLYLRGVEAQSLDWLLDFMYLGEVQVRRTKGG